MSDNNHKERQPNHDAEAMSESKKPGSPDKSETKEGGLRSRGDRVVKAVSAGIAGAAIEETVKESYRQVDRAIHRSDSATPPPEDDGATEVSEEELFTSEDDAGAVEVTIVPPWDTTNQGEDGLEADVPGIFFVGFFVPEQSDLNDLEATNAELVDSLRPDFLELGEALPQFLVDSNGFATPEEMAEADLLPELNIQWMHAESYHIVPGDTLSEIALAHGTSVETLMGLNPHIEDPNLIYAGTDLIVPRDDETPDAPAEVLEAEWTDIPAFQEVESDVEAHGDGDFQPIDWEEFESQGSADYQDALDHSDFDAYDAPASYMDDGFGEADWGDFDASLGFR